VSHKGGADKTCTSIQGD